MCARKTCHQVTVMPTTHLPDVLVTQLRSVIAQVMSDVQAMAPLSEPKLEVLRTRYQPTGCWAPTCDPGTDA